MFGFIWKDKEKFCAFCCYCPRTERCFLFRKITIHAGTLVILFSCYRYVSFEIYTNDSERIHWNLSYTLFASWRVHYISLMCKHFVHGLWWKVNINTVWATYLLLTDSALCVQVKVYFNWRKISTPRWFYFTMLGNRIELDFPGIYNK